MEYQPVTGIELDRKIMNAIAANVFHALDAPLTCDDLNRLRGCIDGVMQKAIVATYMREMEAAK